MNTNDILLAQANSSSDWQERVLTGAGAGMVIILNASSVPELRVLAQSDISGLTAALAAKIASTEKGSSSGVATLDTNGKVPTSQLPDSVLSGNSYQGTWNASTNSPTIPAASSSNSGWRYTVATAGSTQVDGISEWNVGDWIVSNGTAWEKIDNTDSVTSVAGKSGIVVLVPSDVGLGNVVNGLQLLASNLSTDGTLASNSDTLVPSQKACKTYADTKASSTHNHDATYEAKNANIQTHISTTGTPHVSDAEKTTWNAKRSWSSVPASATSSGVAGAEAYDNDYHYVCVATNTWKRYPLATW